MIFKFEFSLLSFNHPLFGLLEDIKVLAVLAGMWARSEKTISQKLLLKTWPETRRQPPTDKVKHIHTSPGGQSSRLARTVDLSAHKKH